MVNNASNISAYDGVPPTEVGNGRSRIRSGPLYEVADVLALLAQGDNKTNLWTRKCVQDVGRLAFDIADVRELLKQALTKGEYINSEWCVQKPTGPWAACDSYRLLRDEWNDNAYKHLRYEYYVKFAIAKTGRLLLLVSCHLSQ